MARHDYKIFSQGKIGALTLFNRLVRSATWDPSILKSRKMTDEILLLYQELAAGGVGMIITGGLPVIEKEMLVGENPEGKACSYEDVHVEGINRIAEAVHLSGMGCKIIAQLEAGYLGAGPSEMLSPFQGEAIRSLSKEEIYKVVKCFIEAILKMKQCGFDGVQLHAAHGGLLSCFLSPYTNRRIDEYGGSVENRVRIVREIISNAKEEIGDFPILIKMNCTDYVEGGLDMDTFPALAKEIENSGVDALEISGGMWDCLVRSEEELGFRPVPAPESHTRIHRPYKQSYFRKFAEKLEIDIPVILVGGNRDIERIEEIVQQGKVDFIALCRPLICEPDLPKRWLEGHGSTSAECISCNSCIYNMIVHPERQEPGIVACILKKDKSQYAMAQEWLSSWARNNQASSRHG